MSNYFPKVVACLACLCVSIEAAAEEWYLAKEGQPEAAIVVGQQASEFHRWVARELQRYVQQLSGAELPIVASDKAPGEKPLIVVGGPQSNPLAASAQEKQLVDFAGLKPDGFVLKLVQLDKVPALLAGGNEEAATMYAAYELLERLGIMFQVSNDIIPEQKRDLHLPALDLRIEPVLKYRGTNLTPHVAWNWGLKEYRSHIDQLAKLKLNFLWFTPTVGGPWLEFSYKGNVPEIICSQETGYLAWGRIVSTSATAKDVRVGRECFPQEYLGPPEFAEVRTQADAYRTARDFLREIIRYAHQRKVQVWIGVASLPYVPPSLVRPGQVTLGSTFYGDALPAGDPALVDIWEAMMGGMIEAYPEADAYSLCNVEEYLSTADAATQKLMGEYAAARKLMPSTVEELRQLGCVAGTPQQLESSLAYNVAVTDKVIQRVKARYPHAKLGVGLFFRPHLLRALDSLLPKDVWLADMGDFMNWKPIMHFFGGIEGRELLVWPRMDDDGCEMNMQLNVTMYERDEILSGSAQYRLAGIVGQMNKERGLECNVRYIAEGAWNPNIRSRSFYEDYLRRVFGSDAVDTLLKAYLILDENDRLIDYRSGWRVGIFYGPAQFKPVQLPLRSEAALETQPKVQSQELNAEITKATAYQQKWTAMASRYRQALDLLRQVRPDTLSGPQEVDPVRYQFVQRKVVLPGAQDELNYVLYKTETFAMHFDVLAACNETVVALDRALLAKNSGDKPEVLKQLEQAQAANDRADLLAREVARQVIPYANIPTESYLLFRYNQHVIGYTENARAALAKVLAFHKAPAR